MIVATNRAPGGRPVPIADVQSGLDRLFDQQEVDVSPASLGYRSAFVGAVLRTLPETIADDATTPARIRLVDPSAAYKHDQAGRINVWWRHDPHQRFWLEITDRHDIGIDLNCPQRDAAGKHSPGFSLIWWVNIGDIVFHYDLNRQAITSWSRAAGPVAEAATIWRSHRSATRKRLKTARPQSGWWLDLDGPFPLGQPLSIAQLVEHDADIRDILRRLKAVHHGSLYFPFFWWDDRQLRPMQYYINKLPAELVSRFPQLATATWTPKPVTHPTTAATPSRPGTVYREAQVSPLSSGRQPFAVDPALVERGLRGHAATQNELARVLRTAGIEPRSRLPQEPNYDLAWEANGRVFVAEIKSITDDNEEEQLRLGLGQVLRYRHRLERLGYGPVAAVLVPERAPRDSSWRDLCRELEVALISGDELERAATL
ncbi:MULTISPECIES: hypothetical protein [Kribbella]|uniref:hypothetical protein n=1 Tax=Kribbella TaxID=182639 RepID=UPI00104BA4C2|nr:MULTISPECIES: hypothetical protein [Kribbella]